MDVTSKSLYSIQIRIKPDDLKRLRNECKKIYRKHHPDLDGYPISDAKILNAVISFYIEE